MKKSSRIGALLATLALLTSLTACDKMGSPQTGTTSPSGPASAASR
jgi:hypothetical protein